MSEFSDSFHLKTSNQNDVIRLLQSAKVKGYMYEEKNGWVTFVVAERSGNIEDALRESNPGVLIHYIYMEDHMWELKIFNNDELVFDYVAEWTDELVIEKNIFDLDMLGELIRQQGNSVEDLELLFDLKDGNLNYEEPPAYVIAQKLGLTYFEWVSADSMEDDDLEDGIIMVNN
ncbi:hypothetical protein [Paenibacillus eucommiae]|uniref:DUF2750 domain-containing protein n=1 Tax=Paenibacillus eucommiae TaxID=1355755 RepID=A0ABS4J2R6_9BACL|nr:hypothetical protein [Paenibacillus eucommiae]MBP1994129.1 hypothetical protein [Paenibacillus eucommiae]